MRLIVAIIMGLAALAMTLAAIWMFYITYLLSADYVGANDPLVSGLIGFGFLFLAGLFANLSSKSLYKD